MVIVSPSDIILQEGKDTMNSTCAMGPRHNLFGGGIVSTIDSWHQINREPVSIKQESSPRSQDSEGSPYSTYSNGNEHHTGYYASYEDNNALSTSKDESNNNNNNSTSSNQSLIPPSETTDEHPDGQSKAQDGDHPPAEEDGDALMRLQLALQRAAGDRQIQCPYCVFVTTSRASLELHLQQSHEDQRSCGFCDFTAETSEKLLEHVRESHSTPTQLNTTDPDVRDDEDEPGLTVPKINSQGKVKTFRCKQCDFSAVTKLEFWEHTRSHIKQERLLTCPRCPFVTEYKHHLEYHLRNHFGSKPFKCDKCSYSCVNKSMLNSHLKSHSNVYQFSCADCNYATKYCHSLKLHLRKYDHKPAMVLNPDGSPNPLPIIDVYGTRRGPKMKHSRTSHNLDDQQSQSRTSPQHISSPLSIPEHPQQLQHQQPNLIHPLFASAYGLPYYNPLLHPLMYHAGKAAASQDAGLGSSVAMAEHQQDKANFYFNNNNIINNNCSQNGDEKEEVDMRFSPSMQLIETTTEQQRSSEDLSRVPLDLSRWDATTSQEEHSRSPPPRIVTQERRRKGKAYKLETLRQERTSEDDDEMRDTIETSSSSSKRRHDDSDDGELPLKCVLVEQESSASASPEADRTSAKKAQSADSDSESYNCNYCDITFRDVVMYTMHMGYHGFGNPYTCNMCGETTADRVAFFLHIARTPHS